MPHDPLAPLELRARLGDREVSEELLRLALRRDDAKIVRRALRSIDLSLVLVQVNGHDAPVPLRRPRRFGRDALSYGHNGRSMVAPFARPLQWGRHIQAAWAARQIRHLVRARVAAGIMSPGGFDLVERAIAHSLAGEGMANRRPPLEHMIAQIDLIVGAYSGSVALEYIAMRSLWARTVTLNSQGRDLLEFMLLGAPAVAVVKRPAYRGLGDGESVWEGFTRIAMTRVRRSTDLDAGHIIPTD